MGLEFGYGVLGQSMHACNIYQELYMNHSMFLHVGSVRRVKHSVPKPPPVHQEDESKGLFFIIIGSFIL